MEFESSKHEVRRLSEEVDLLHEQLEELINLKKIVEKQMKEALEALQASFCATKVMRISANSLFFTSPSILIGRKRGEVRPEEGT